MLPVPSSSPAECPFYCTALPSACPTISGPSPLPAAYFARSSRESTPSRSIPQPKTERAAPQVSWLCSVWSTLAPKVPPWTEARVAHNGKTCDNSLFIGYLPHICSLPQPPPVFAGITSKHLHLKPGLWIYFWRNLTKTRRQRHKDSGTGCCLTPGPTLSSTILYCFLIQLSHWREKLHLLLPLYPSI